jgi:hypothetical protein
MNRMTIRKMFPCTGKIRAALDGWMEDRGWMMEDWRGRMAETAVRSPHPSALPRGVQRNLSLSQRRPSLLSLTSRTPDQSPGGQGPTSRGPAPGDRGPRTSLPDRSPEPSRVPVPRGPERYVRCFLRECSSFSYVLLRPRCSWIGTL